MTDTRYCYPPEFDVLRNKFELRDARAFEHAEGRAVANRMQQQAPGGDFDLPHLQVIHKHLFQDVYDWAGQVREVEISKNEHQFQPRRFIEAGMDDVHRRLREHDFLRNQSLQSFAYGAGKIIGDVNYVHPFREGNGRTQAVYLEQLSRQAGHQLRIDSLQRDKWIEASRQAHTGNYEPFRDHIREALEKSRERDREEQKRQVRERETLERSRQRKRDQDRER